MKSIFSVIFFVIWIANHSHAQYTVEYSTDNYIGLVNADTVDESQFYVVNNITHYLPVPIGFGYEIEGEFYDSITIADKGYVIFENVNAEYFISVYDCLMKDFNDDPMNSSLLYTTEGTAGNRIFKLEYKTMGFVNDLENDDFISFQLWLYESCEKFDVRIGDHQINSDVFFTNEAPWIGVYRYNSWLLNMSGSPFNPVLDSTITTLDGHPSVNTVYTFSNCSANINELNQTFSIYPNPVNDQLTVMSENFIEDLEIDVFDLLGMKVDSIVINGTSNNQIIEVEHLSKGAYLLVLTSNGQKSSYKVIKN
jgi:hypothetical protein